MNISYKARELNIQRLILTLILLFLLVHAFRSLFFYPQPHAEMEMQSRSNAEQERFVANGVIYEKNRDLPLIFIGGHSRSGTTLMRAMLESHPMVR